ncbi:MULTISPECIES: class I SAM-dependent methyltransferase [Agrobacterium]|uniref:RNA methyltransferase n=1 Tax=Agrobacterium arsenijevicii TaxID=1585697 RepID=A0ABR5D0J5_9HYPH|nr:class I SAM-dependent methyltransferase [Agrobacterium fabrum]KJF70531.1 RNA methyltransferase [Agrobacterium arsenijevicii]
MLMLRNIALACTFTMIPLGNALAQTTAPQTSSPTYTPDVGQHGKDVIWVPTPQALVDRMLEMAGITENDYVIDLGSGDGRTVVSVAKLGARAHGIEYNPDMVALSRRNAQEAGVADRATFAEEDIFQSDFSDASVITLFLLPELNVRLRPTLLDMKPGTRVVSNSFNMGDWQPDDRVEAGEKCENYCRAFKWVVPAKVAGDWRHGEGKLSLTQNYQMLSGTLTNNGTAHAISEAKIDGTRISFTAGGMRYTGSVSGESMTVGTQGGVNWTATRSQD